MENEPVQPIVTESPVETTPANNLKQKRSGLVFVLVALVLLLLGTTVYFLTQNFQGVKKTPTQTELAVTPTIIPTIDPTSDWKTYSNTLFDFTFLYPPDLILYDQLKQVGDNLLLQNFESLSNRIQNPNDFQLVLSVNKDEGKKLEEYPKLWEKELGILPSERILIGGKEAIKEFSVSKYKPVPTVWVKNGSYLFTFQLTIPESTKKDIFDQILSTFKFTGSIDKSISETYSIEIPPSWISKYKLTNNNDGFCDIYKFIGKTQNYELFSICRMTNEKWNLNQTLSGPEKISTEKRLTSNDIYVYYYFSTIDNPYTEEAEIKSYGTLASNIPSIIESFKLR